MPQTYRDNRSHFEGTAAAAEASVRQLILNGKHKTAVERAKEIHKTQGTAASEALLVDAYAARIQSLLEQNLAMEAKALLELVRERYPSARMHLDRVTASAAARAGTLDELVQPLSDPALAVERRAAIEHAIQKEIYDLAALARCAALSPEDPLRTAAGALERAFAAVTSGPVAEDALALPEVSHRSPLASWKLLVRAIACFYRREDDSCRKYLDAIKPGSPPARLVPAIQAMLSGKTGAPLPAAAAALVSGTTGNAAAVQGALVALDQAFASDNEARILKTIRTAVQECQQKAPGLLERLKQHISVRCAMADVSKGKVAAAMGGACRHDAYFLRLFAFGMERTRDPENLAISCGAWNDFRQRAVAEGWFAANGGEVAAIYLHIADVLAELPDRLLWELHHSQSAGPRSKLGNKQAAEDWFFLYPEKLYARACALDPHSAAFSQWMDWAKHRAGWEAERVAEAWHKILPQDIKPVLYLMEATENRNALHTALQYLAKAERIDGVNPDVRRARLRLLARSAMRHILQKKPHLADAELAEMAALPQAQQGDRPAFLAALRYVVSVVRGDGEQAASHRAEVERLLESSVATPILLCGVAAACKRGALEGWKPVEKLTADERAALPAAVARVTALADDVQMDLRIPWSWIVETAKQFPPSRRALGTSQLRTLGQVALSADQPEFAYAVSAAGLERGGPTEARFLLLRAQSLPDRQRERRAVCAAAAADLARQQRDVGLVEEAVGLLRGPLQSDGLSLTPDQVRQVLQKEKGEPAAFPDNRPGPDYRDIVAEKLCHCPRCRRARGESVDPSEDFDDGFDLDEEALLDEIPEDMPPELARILLEETKKAVRSGESLDELMARLLGGMAGKNGKKGRRR